MTTRVVNIKLDRCEVYIGRAGHGYDGYFGNPHRNLQRRDSIALYQRTFPRRIADDPVFRQRVAALRGKVLGCFCAPSGGLGTNDPLLCHGQVIAGWLDGVELPLLPLPSTRR